MEKEFYKLFWDDGAVLTVERKILEECLVFKDMLQFTTSSNDDEEVKIFNNFEIMAVGSELMTFVVTFLEQKMVENPEEIVNEKLTKMEYDFFEKLTPKSLIKILNVANYLNIPKIIQAGLEFLRHKVTGKSCQEIRQILDLPDDYSDKEKRKMAKDFEILDVQNDVIEN
uniref:SKP1-like protein n=1 Tax=Panagrolaimus sp. JU765 TaxID=591449 RepID=A0AC34QLM4_9BILA